MSSRPRSAVPERHRWDLSRVFADADAWEAAHADLTDRINDLHTRAESATDSATALQDALDTYERAVCLDQRVSLYASLREKTDTSDETRTERATRARKTSAALEEARRALFRHLAAHPDAVERHRDGVGDRFAGLLEDVLREREHTLGPEGERVLAAVSDALDSPKRTYWTVTNEDFDAPTVAGPGGGDAVEVTWLRLQTALRHPDREFRRRAFEAYYERLGRVEGTATRAIADVVASHVARADARDYDSVREMALRKETYPSTGRRLALPESVHDTLTGTVHEALDPWHRAHERRRETLGVDQLRPWDLRVPLATHRDDVADADPEVSVDEATNLLLDAVAPLGEAYRETLAGLLAERRVDALPHADREDLLGFGPWGYDPGPYLFVTYDGTVKAASILAHELGHAVAAEHLREARDPLDATMPRPVEEVPSLLHELLLADHLFDERPDLAPFARDRLLEFLGGNLFRTARNATLGHRAHRHVEDGGDLGRERLAGWHTDLVAEFQPAVEPPETDRRWLAGSYRREPYHHYQYVLGAAGSTAVFDGLRAGDLTPADYRTFLRTGATEDSVTMLSRLGADPREPSTYERAATVFDRYVD
ncbi:M3 family metallopeptidase [Salinirubellus salinus]|uniref:M3 family metallopeptidase n=1 Tax=Salinirubellus salinus TaxID=1364945 RepID=A0A9E7UAY5_9EURY|nr:M3 family metallopeptidase [Salinirubellus salinus]UWM54678.1 M3 family metallopeptidase [Salinirubellus salinus]UWM54748.1 M3 family metallopeptidase [Salinirubellus salinus]